MGIVVDLIIIAVVLLFILLGYRKGLTGSLIKLLSFIIAVVISLVFYKPLANILIDNTQIDENIKASMTETFIHEQEPETDEEKNMPSTILDSINKDNTSFFIFQNSYILLFNILNARRNFRENKLSSS